MLSNDMKINASPHLRKFSELYESYGLGAIKNDWLLTCLLPCKIRSKVNTEFRSKADSFPAPSGHPWPGYFSIVFSVQDPSHHPVQPRQCAITVRRQCPARPKPKLIPSPFINFNMITTSPTLDLLTQMRLHGMRHAYQSAQASGALESSSPEEVLALLVQAEWEERHNRSSDRHLPVPVEL